MRKMLLIYCSSFLITTSIHSQNVGIGTSAPGSRLEVVGSEITPNGKNAAITIINTASTREWYLRSGAMGTFTPKGGFSIADNLYYRLVIDSIGNIGIGIINPQHKLDVNGDACFNNNSIYLGTPYDLSDGLQYLSQVGGPYLFGYSGGALGTKYINTIKHSLAWDDNGNVAVRSNLAVDTAGINNGNLSNILRFGKMFSGEGIGSKRTAGGNQYGLDFYAGFTNRMVITHEGNVGINTTTPSETLEVVGGTKTSSLQVGNNGSSISNIQRGIFTIGTSAGASKTVTFNFPNAFTQPPVLVVTVRNDAGYNVGDTFVASIRSISNTSVTFNIQRVDIAGGWAQNLLLNWIAME